jgi:hypothetical protein
MHQRAQSVPHNRVPLARLSFRAENSNLEFPDNGPAAKVAETIEPLSEPPTPTTCSANPCAAAHRSEVASNIWKHLPGRTCTGTGLDSAERQVQPVQVCGAAEDQSHWEDAGLPGLCLVPPRVATDHLHLPGSCTLAGAALGPPTANRPDSHRATRPCLLGYLYHLPVSSQLPTLIPATTSRLDILDVHPNPPGSAISLR